VLQGRENRLQRPRIGFNIFPYRDTRSGGMLYYALILLRQFSRTIPDQVTLFCGRHSRKLLSGIKSLARVNTREIRDPAEIFNYRGEFDVLFTPASWGGVNMLDYPTIHVLPDIQEQFYPEFFCTDDLRNRNLVHSWVSKSSTILITKSNFSKSTIIEKFGVPKDKVRVTPDAAHPIFSDESDRGVRPSNMPEVESFLFYPANSWNHKNHRALLDALVALRGRHGLSISVILSGNLLTGDYNHFDIPAEIKIRNLGNQVFHIGRTDLRAVKFLYLNAAALIHPSLFEGFGIPLVEAMSCGCPVVAARATSIPEVCGESALYFDPHDPSDIADKIKQFFEHPDDADARRRSGKEKARQYSDHRTASETLAIINEAYELASEKSVEKRIRSRRPIQRTPLLSVLFSTQECCADDNCSAVTSLLSDLLDLIQIICIRCPAMAERRTCSPSGCLCFDGSESIHAALKSAVEVASGHYLCFADKHSIPLRSFVIHLMDMQGNGELGELLHGESYSKDLRTGYLRDRISISDEDGDALEAASCSKLSFVVRSDVFTGFVNESRAEWGSFREMALSLWQNCEKKRIYTVVNYNIGSHLDELLERFTTRLSSQGVIRRLVDTRIGRFACIEMLRVYCQMPNSIQEIIRTCWRAVRST
jgi:glycosyltransferase involved in cell wall biosynthesis